MEVGGHHQTPKFRKKNAPNLKRSPQKRQYWWGPTNN
jgi:hypothetical protein